MNSTLRKEVDSVQSSIVLSAQRQPLPKRFKSIGSMHSSHRTIIDTKTGRRVSVGLHAYGAVRKTLNALFSDQ